MHKELHELCLSEKYLLRTTFIYLLDTRNQKLDTAL